MANETMTSGFSNATERIEDIRKDLAEKSIALEEERQRFTRNVAKGHKEVEMNNSEIDTMRREDKKMRLKVN